MPAARFRRCRHWQGRAPRRGRSCGCHLLWPCARRACRRRYRVARLTFAKPPWRRSDSLSLRQSRFKRSGPGIPHVHCKRAEECSEMPPRGVKKGSKRARQYEEVKKSEKKAGRSESRAEEIAARTVNKEKARSGESRSSSRSSTR